MKIYTEKQFEKELERRMYERERDQYMNDRFRRLEEKIEKLLYPEPIPEVPVCDPEIRAHCNLKENAKLIAQILDFDDEGMVFDWYEQHIAQAIEWYVKYTVEKTDLTDKAVALYKENVDSLTRDVTYKTGFADALVMLLYKFGIDLIKEANRIGDDED